MTKAKMMNTNNSGVYQPYYPSLPPTPPPFHPPEPVTTRNFNDLRASMAELNHPDYDGHTTTQRSRSAEIRGESRFDDHRPSFDNDAATAVPAFVSAGVSMIPSTSVRYECYLFQKATPKDGKKPCWNHIDRKLVPIGQDELRAKIQRENTRPRGPDVEQKYSELTNLKRSHIGQLLNEKNQESAGTLEWSLASVETKDRNVSRTSFDTLSMTVVIVGRPTSAEGPRIKPTLEEPVNSSDQVNHRPPHHHKNNQTSRVPNNPHDVHVVNLDHINQYQGDFASRIIQTPPVRIINQTGPSVPKLANQANDAAATDTPNEQRAVQAQTQAQDQPASNMAGLFVNFIVDPATGRRVPIINRSTVAQNPVIDISGPNHDTQYVQQEPVPADSRGGNGVPIGNMSAQNTYPAHPVINAYGKPVIRINQFGIGSDATTPVNRNGQIDPQVQPQHSSSTTRQPDPTLVQTIQDDHEENLSENDTTFSQFGDDDIDNGEEDYDDIDGFSTDDSNALTPATSVTSVSRSADDINAGHGQRHRHVAIPAGSLNDSRDHSANSSTRRNRSQGRSHHHDNARSSSRFSTTSIPEPDFGEPVVYRRQCPNPMSRMLGTMADRQMPGNVGERVIIPERNTASRYRTLSPEYNVRESSGSRSSEYPRREHLSPAAAATHPRRARDEYPEDTIDQDEVGGEEAKNTRGRGSLQLANHWQDSDAGKEDKKRLERELSQRAERNRIRKEREVREAEEYIRNRKRQSVMAQEGENAKFTAEFHVKDSLKRKEDIARLADERWADDLRRRPDSIVVSPVNDEDDGRDGLTRDGMRINEPVRFPMYYTPGFHGERETVEVPPTSGFQYGYQVAYGRRWI